MTEEEKQAYREADREFSASHKAGAERPEDNVTRLKDGRYTWKDFLAYLPEPNAYIFTPAGADEMWPAKNVDVVCKGPPIIDPNKAQLKNANECEIVDGTRDRFERDENGNIMYQTASVAVLFDRKQRVGCMTWWPGKSAVIRDTVVREGGAIPMRGMNSFNRYRKPRLKIGDHPEPTRWLDHIKLIYPDDWRHIVSWLAYRVQHPEIKILHALVLGGATRIGKDTLLKPVAYAIGPWNFKTTNAQTIMDEPKYNGYLESVICLINEAQDFGDQDRYAFYNRMKPWLGGTAANVLMVADKYVRAHPVIDVFDPIITTNHKVRGLYLPEDDARHYIAWSNRTWEDWGLPDLETLDEKYFGPIYRWYADGGYELVAQYLMTFDLAKFSPTAPPPKTAAWHEIVNAYTDPNKSALTQIMETLADPLAVTVDEVQAADSKHELTWLDGRGRNTVPAQMEEAGYVHQRNPNAKNGRWQVGLKDKRRLVTIYVKAKLTEGERLKAAREVFAREQGRRGRVTTDADDFGA